MGKTEVAKVLARWTGGELIRLQCYEGIDVAQAVYEWDYSRQLLHLRAAEAAGRADGDGADALEDELYSERFLVRRPLLQAIDRTATGPPPVLLIDEVDRADDEFEAFLLEILSDYAVTVPELGTFRADGAARSSSSPRTAPATCTTPSSAAASTTGSSTPTSSARWRSCGCGRPRSAERWPARWRPRSQAHARARALQAAGRGRDHRLGPGAGRRSAATTLDEAAVDATLGTVLKYREDQERVRGHGLDDAGRGRRSLPWRLTAADGRARRGRRSPGCCAAPGLDVPVGSRRSPFAEALGERRASTAGRGVYWAGRATLVRRPEDIAAYDRAFAAFWLRRDRGRPAPTAAAPVDARRSTTTTATPAPATTPTTRPTAPTSSVRYSAAEVLRHKDFAACTRRRARRGPPADGRPAARPARCAASRRRRRPRAGRGRLDLRRTVRRALRAGGEPVAPAHRRRPATRPRRLVLLRRRERLDGALRPGAAALRPRRGRRAGRRVEAFALGTRLTRLTRELSAHDPDAALAAGGAAPSRDWSGGTRLGDGLRAFNDEWGVRGMARGAVVVILSDGWDRGDPDVLAEQMARLRRVAHRVVWVNPLKASPGYAPLARGMAAALPYVDEFVEGHSLAVAASDAASEVIAPMKEILDDLDRWRRPGKRVAVARVVDVEGSGPRLPGAAMAVNEDGEVAGSVSGGCVEGAVVTEALDVLGTGDRRHGDLRLQRRRGLRGRPHLRRHDPPVHRAARLVSADALRRARATRCGPSGRWRWPRSSTGRHSGAKLLVAPGRASRSASLGDPDLDRVVARDALGELAAGTTGVRHYGAARRGPRGRRSPVFVESLRPAAPDADLRRRRLHRRAGPRGQGARLPGDGVRRPRGVRHHGAASRWPTRSSSTGPTGCSSGSAPTLGPRDAVCVLTHDPKFDVPAIVAALATDVGYLGAMGRRRTHADRGRAAARGGRRRRRARPAHGADRPRHRRPHARGDRGVDLRRDHRPAHRPTAAAPLRETTGPDPLIAPILTPTRRATQNGKTEPR